MSEPTDTQDEENQDAKPDSMSVVNQPKSRRQLLSESVAASGALVLGIGAMGSVSASGKGGQAAVYKSDYREGQEFEVTKRVESAGDVFDCERGGNGIYLAKWKIEYTDEDTEKAFFTRDNNVVTGEIYSWKPPNGGSTDCGDFVLTPFSPTN